MPIRTNRSASRSYNEEKIRLLVGIAAVLIVFAALAAVLLIVVYDHRYGYDYPVRDFADNGKMEPYAREIPLHEMDLSVYRKYLPQADAMLSVDMDTMIALPCDVEYYEQKEDAEPVLILKKGMVVNITPGMTGFSFSLKGYGLECWPDYEAEWRYGCPFTTVDDIYVVEENTMYYVKAVQLEKVAEAFYRVNKRLYRYAVTPWDFPEVITQSIDRSLYEHGAFCPERWKKEPEKPEWTD